VKCPDCGAKAKHNPQEDVYYCTACLWDEVLDTMEWA
jgi:ribosomal protein L37AE/L43A